MQYNNVRLPATLNSLLKMMRVEGYRLVLHDACVTGRYCILILQENFEESLKTTF